MTDLVTHEDHWKNQACRYPIDVVEPERIPFRRPRKRNIQEEEDKLSCKCLKTPIFIEFSAEILYTLIKKGLTNSFSKEKMKKIMEPTKNEKYKDTIDKPGIDSDMSGRLIDFVSNGQWDEFLSSADNVQLNMGAVYDFQINPEYILMVIPEETKEKITERSRELFCCKALTFDMIRKQLYSGQNTRYLLDILAFTLGDKNFYRANIINNKYMRTLKKKPHFSDPSSNCHKDMVPSKGMKIQTGNTYYQVVKDSLFASIMSEYGRPYMAGPSGSTIVLYIFIFRVLGIEENDVNKAKMLGVIISDYVPYFHTLTEILLTFSPEVGGDYDISQDPSQWCLNYIQTFLPEFGLDLGSKRYKKTNKRKKKRKSKKRKSRKSKKRK